MSTGRKLRAFGAVACLVVAAAQAAVVDLSGQVHDAAGGALSGVGLELASRRVASSASYSTYGAFDDWLPLTAKTTSVLTTAMSMALGEARDVHVVAIAEPDSIHPKQRLVYIRYFPDRDSLAERTTLYTATDSQKIGSPDIALGPGGKALVAFYLDRGCDCSVNSTGSRAVYAVKPDVGEVSQVSENPTNPASTQRVNFEAHDFRPKAAWIAGVPTVVYAAYPISGYQIFLAAATPSGAGWSNRKAVSLDHGHLISDGYSVGRRADKLVFASLFGSPSYDLCAIVEGGKSYCTPSAYNGFLRNMDPSVDLDDSGRIHMAWGDDKAVVATSNSKDSGAMHELIWNPDSSAASILTFDRWVGGATFDLPWALDRVRGGSVWFKQLVSRQGTLWTLNRGRDTAVPYFLSNIGYREGETVLQARDGFVALLTYAEGRIHISTLSDSVPVREVGVDDRAVASVAGPELRWRSGTMRIEGLVEPAEVVLSDLEGRVVLRERVAGDGIVARTARLRGTFVARISTSRGVSAQRILLP